MWIRTSSVLLATLVVSGLSFPHPDKEYKIPVVGSGPRSQYYVLHSDGTFKYGFDTGDDAFESVKSHSLGNREGNFGYVDPDGKTIRLEYEAGVGGFVARGDHLPKPSPELAEAIAAVVRSSKPFIDPLAGTDGDSSYDFSFQADDHSRNEQSDADGTVTGSYSYIDEFGNKRNFNYKAGKGIGFVIEGDGLTDPVSSVPASTSTASVRASSVQRAPTPSQQYNANLRGSSRSSRPINTGSFGTGVTSFRSQTPGDASYSFSFDTGEHSRNEQSDRDLNVNGAFSFIGDDGDRRTVNYVAGSGTGFQAQGAHLPKVSEVTSSRSTQTSSQLGTKLKSSFSGVKPVSPLRSQSTAGAYSGSATHQQHRSNVQSSSSSRVKPVSQHRSQSTAGTYTGSTAQHQQVANVKSSFSGVKPVSQHRSHSTVGAYGSDTQQQHKAPTTSQGFAHGLSVPLRKTSISSRPFEEANIRSSSSPSGAYSFSYDTSSHSRSESGDENNKVVGNFAFVADDDGQRRELSYEAGSGTGFIAEGAHIPVGPEVPGAPSGQPTGRLVRVSSQPFVDPLASSDSDASYKFGFDSDTYSRSETADEDGNIVGTYTIVDVDGTRVTYRFKAGKGIGFETEEISRSQGPAPAVPIPYSGPLAPAHLFPAYPTPGQSSFRQSSVASVPQLKHSSVASIPQLKHSSVASVSQYKQSSAAVAPHSATSSHQSTKFTGASRSHESNKFFSHKTPFQQQSPSAAHFSSQSSFTAPQVGIRSSSNPSHSHQVFPGFTLHTYEAAPDAEKFGYVLKYDD